MVAVSLSTVMTPVNDVMAELATEYDGTVLVAEDLMTIQIGNNVSVIPFRHGGKPSGMVG